MSVTVSKLLVLGREPESVGNSREPLELMFKSRGMLLRCNEFAVSAAAFHNKCCTGFAIRSLL